MGIYIESQYVHQTNSALLKILDPKMACYGAMDFDCFESILQKDIVIVQVKDLFRDRVCYSQLTI